MPQTELEGLNITIDTSEDLETIIMSFIRDGEDSKAMSIGFSIPEAQQLNMWLSEAVSAVLLQKCITPSATKH